MISDEEHFVFNLTINHSRVFIEELFNFYADFLKFKVAVTVAKLYEFFIGLEYLSFVRCSDIFFHSA